jgi:hypothetical protein
VRAIDVFGTRLLADRTPDGWRLWTPADDGKRRPVHELPIPAFVTTEDELLRYLADLCHEGATPARPDVRWVDPPA